MWLSQAVEPACWLYSEPLVVIVTARYLLERHVINEPDDLIHHQCLFASSLVGGDRWEFRHGEKHEFFKIPDTVQRDDSDVLRPLVLNDAGIACLPRQLVQKDIENGRLVELLQDYVASTFDICLYYRKLEFAPVRMNNFKTCLENYCRQPENMANLFKISSR